MCVPFFWNKVKLNSQQEETKKIFVIFFNRFRPGLANPVVAGLVHCRLVNPTQNGNLDPPPMQPFFMTDPQMAGQAPDAGSHSVVCRILETFQVVKKSTK